MKPESAASLRKSREFLAKPRNQLEVMNYNDEAGRAAYLAGPHAAQALIFERTDKVIKRHRGVHAELRRLTEDEPRFDPELHAFLARAYNLKTVADYETGDASQVTVEEAQQAIEARPAVRRLHRGTAGVAAHRGLAPLRADGMTPGLKKTAETGEAGMRSLVRLEGRLVDAPELHIT